jgi:hypothetical protein
MPLQYMLTAEAQRRIGRYGQLHPDDPKGLLGTPVGQIVGRMKSIPSSRDVVYNMVEEAIETLRELGDLLGIEESAR